jgi:RNA recognition motif-containing protein
VIEFPSVHRKLILAALPGTATAERLREWVERVGPVDDLRVIHGVGKPLNRRFAYVDVPDPQIAQRLVDELNGTLFDGKPLRVYPAPRRPERDHAHDSMPIE